VPSWRGSHRPVCDTCEKLPSLPTSGRDPESILDREDALEAMALIREHAHNDGHRDILLLLILTAQRKSDIRLRRWEDLILDHPDVTIPHLRCESHKSRRRTKAAKLIALSPPALAILIARWPGSTIRLEHDSDGDAWVARDPTRSWPMSPTSVWAAQLPHAEGPIFPGTAPSKPLTDVWHAWREIAKKATRKRVKASDVHGLRHAASSLMLAAGVPRELIQKALHHSPSLGRSVTDRYLHETYDVYQRLWDALRGVL